MRLPVRAIALSLCFSLSVLPALAQAKKPRKNTEEADAEAAQQRTIIRVKTAASLHDCKPSSWW